MGSERRAPEHVASHVTSLEVIAQEGVMPRHFV